MKIRVSFFIAILSVFSPFYGYTQGPFRGLSVSMNGYVIEAAGKLFFQQCDDSTKDVWESINGDSFALGYFQEDQFPEAISQLGDSVIILFSDQEDSQKHLATFRSFYAKVDLDLIFSSDSPLTIYKSPRIDIKHGDRLIHMEGFFVDNRIRKLIPQKEIDLNTMRAFYLSLGSQWPPWLKH